ncbi:bacterio-opsin activator [Cohnella thailandensis]|uniref:Bacterio-opsin activator n=1 Tax=Cohnella thailandensis TaxID=557557 RepID=A0A841SYP7_9BACL|nr:bacterio-opsin activator [Cohnella thailandensis]MBB6635746.1 bacterio-opsin activator [Cohnella thailandensis]MBP1976124.1 hypothetical protein [Cohnella thailandensis]
MERLTLNGNGIGNGLGSRVIGLDNELEALAKWMAEPGAGTRLLSVSGIGGIGKTTLLTEMARKTRESSLPTLWLDGQSELLTSVSFLSGLEASLASEYGRVRSPDTPLLTFVVSELSRQRTVLLIDNGESLDRLEGWLLSSFLPKLESASVLIVVASRNELSVKWRTNPYWGPRFSSLHLRLFTREEVVAYLRDSGLSTELQIEVAQRTDGHPLLLALTVDWLKSRQGEERRALLEIPAILSAELLREVVSPALYPALTVLSLLPAADHALLNRFLEIPLDPAGYKDLGTLSFIRATPYGLSMHHVASRLLREEYAAKSPLLFQDLRQRIIRLLTEQFHAADKRLQMRYAAHILELYREFLPIANAYANFSSNLRPGEYRPYRPEDLPHLQRFLAAAAPTDWQTELARAEDYPSLLASIAESCPEGICVVRDELGVPLAFCAGVWLNGMTLPILERYAPGFLPILNEDSDRSPSLSPETADTLCILLAAVDVRQSIYRPEELGALLMQQWLIMMTSGLRGITVTADPNLKSLLPALGFKERGSVDPFADKLTVWELDFRQSSFDEWVKRIIRQTGETAAATIYPHASESVPKIDFVAMKRILEHLFESEDPVRSKVLELLTAELPMPPLTTKDQLILRELYVQKARNKEELAGAFYMSRTTFYRHTRTAIRRLAEAIALALTFDSGKIEST